MTSSLPLHSTMLWPRAELEQLYILMLLIGWLFLWHDTVESLDARVYDSRALPTDSRDHSAYSRAGASDSRDHFNDSGDYAKYGQDSKDFLRHCLQIIYDDAVSKSFSVKDGIKTLWSSIRTGRGLNAHYDVPKKLNPIVHMFETIRNQIRTVYTTGKHIVLVFEAPFCLGCFINVC